MSGYATEAGHVSPREREGSRLQCLGHGLRWDSPGRPAVAAHFRHLKHGRRPQNVRVLVVMILHNRRELRRTSGEQDATGRLRIVGLKCRS